MRLSMSFNQSLRPAWFRKAVVFGKRDQLRVGGFDRQHLGRPRIGEVGDLHGAYGVKLGYRPRKNLPGLSGYDDLNPIGNRLPLEKVKNVTELVDTVRG